MLSFQLLSSLTVVVVVVVVQVQVTTCGTAKVAKGSYFASHLNELPPALGYRSETIISKDVSHDVCKKNYSTQRKKSKWLAQLYTRFLVKKPIEFALSCMKG